MPDMRGPQSPGSSVRCVVWGSRTPHSRARTRTRLLLQKSPEGCSPPSAAVKCTEATRNEGKSLFFSPQAIPSRHSGCMCARCGRGLTLYHSLRSSSTKTHLCGEQDISRKKTLWRVKRQKTITEQSGFSSLRRGADANS